MGPGVKYHVVTVSAIFFALAIGLVFGSLFLSPQLVAQQRRSIKKMQDTLSKMDLQDAAQLKHYQEFAAQALPLLVQNRLNGANVAVIQTGDYPEASARVREALTLAGARVLSVTGIGAGLDRPDEALNADLGNLNASDSRAYPNDRSTLCQAVASALAHGDTSADGLLAELDRAHLVDLDESGDYARAAQYVVIITGSRSADSARTVLVDQPLIKALRKAGVEVVACEPENVTSSDLAEYEGLHIEVPMVSEVDTDIGRCALVFALRGDRMFFGVREPAVADASQR